MRSLLLLGWTLGLAVTALGCAEMGAPTSPKTPVTSLVIGVEQTGATTTLRLASYRACPVRSPSPKPKEERPARSSVGVPGSMQLVLVVIVVAALFEAVATGPSKTERSDEPPPKPAPPPPCVPEPTQPRVARVRSGKHDVVVPVDAMGRASVPFSLEAGWTVVVDGVYATPAW